MFKSKCRGSWITKADWIRGQITFSIVDWGLKFTGYTCGREGDQHVLYPDLFLMWPIAIETWELGYTCITLWPWQVCGGCLAIVLFDTQYMKAILVWCAFNYLENMLLRLGTSRALALKLLLVQWKINAQVCRFGCRLSNALSNLICFNPT